MLIMSEILDADGDVENEKFRSITSVGVVVALVL